MSPSKQEIGDRVRNLRTAAGLTQVALSETSGVPQTTISAIERGFTASPGADVLALIAGALGVSVNELVGGAPAELDTVQLPGWSQTPDEVKAAIRTIVRNAGTHTA